MLKSGKGGGAARWAPALIGRWEADRLAPLLAACVPRPAIYGAEIQPLRTCTPASGDTGDGRGLWSARGFGRREEVQYVLAGGQNAALTPQLLAVSSHPSTAGLAVPGRGKRSPYPRLPSSKSQRLYFKHPLPKPMLNWLEKALLV